MMGAQGNEKLTTRDLITLAVFTVLFSLIMMVINFIGAIPVLHPFAAGISLIPCGIVWMYLRAKVPKTGSVFIQVIVMLLIYLLLGSAWWQLLIMAVASIIVELVTQPRQKNIRKITVGYVLFGVFYTAIANLPPLIACDYYYNSCITNMEPDLVNRIIAFMTVPVVIASLILSVLCSLLGVYLGRKMLKKHFDRAGIC